VTRLLLAATFCLAALAAPGCGPACHPTERVVTDGIRDVTGPVRTYETSPPEGPFLPFEGNTMLRIRHGLGVRPTTVEVELAFSERPFDPAKGGFSSAAGNQAIHFRRDAEEIAVKNDSCANYYIRVVVLAAADDDAGAADASMSDTSVTDASDGG